MGGKAHGVLHRRGRQCLPLVNGHKPYWGRERDVANIGKVSKRLHLGEIWALHLGEHSHADALVVGRPEPIVDTHEGEAVEVPLCGHNADLASGSLEHLD